ncbi:hypothetical protein PRZ48_010660 [Zasmidium cellare]|uniref:Uncharacterized protein n=1 Tax=Zasmidium cellare TaxID=395010 RepID=A0ABR0E9B4_ZASCE|nr:hypothetical protein PRZ48_010660 [Zasmidium cellare]
MQSSKSIRPSTQDHESPMPEHACSTAAEAFRILDEKPLAPIVKLEEYYQRLLVNPDPEVISRMISPILAEIDKATKQTTSEGFIRWEGDTIAILDGRKFKFDKCDDAFDFALGSREHIMNQLGDYALPMVKTVLPLALNSQPEVSLIPFFLPYPKYLNRFATNRNRSQYDRITQKYSVSIMQSSTEPGASPPSTPPPPYSPPTPEHFCSTAAEALELVNRLRLCPYDIFEQKYDTILNSKPAVMVLHAREIGDAYNRADEQAHSTDYCPRMEASSTVFYAGHSFKFDMFGAGQEFITKLRHEQLKKGFAVAKRTSSHQNSNDTVALTFIMQLSTSTSSSTPANASQFTASTEHYCTTLDYAHAIVRQQCKKPVDAYEAKWYNILRSNDPIPESVQKTTVEELRKVKGEIESWKFAHYEQGQDVIYAGHKFKFSEIQSAQQFAKEAENHQSSEHTRLMGRINAFMVRFSGENYEAIGRIY